MRRINSRQFSWWIFAGLFLALPFTFLACVMGGGGSEAVAVKSGGSEVIALTGSFTDANQNPVGYARVRLRPKLFLSDTSQLIKVTSGIGGQVYDTRTDVNGAFKIDSVKQGDYLIEVTDSLSGGVLLPCTLNGDTDKVNLKNAMLLPTGSVTGSIVPPQGFKGQTYLQVYGIDRAVKTDSVSGKFTMENLPPGIYTLRAVYSANAVDPKEIDSVESRSSDTNDIGSHKLASFENENYASWPNSLRIYLNTTEKGANIIGNVDRFALLVRLTRSQFDFSQSTGDDIRFSDSKGKRLRYEVERWDSAAGLAEIWVGVDRVTGNSSAQFITLHWGVPGAASWSDGRQVFSGDAGFAGVWHLREEATDTTTKDLYKDACGYNPADDKVLSTNRMGVIGMGHGFVLKDHISIQVADPLLQPNSAITVSSWIKASKTSAQGGHVLSMGNNYNLQIMPDGTGRFTLNGTTLVKLDTKESVLDDNWHFLAATYDGVQMSIYLDGKLSNSLAYTGFIEYKNWPTFAIGKRGDKNPGSEFIGNLDEIQVSGEVARLGDWLKLGFENQRTGSTLLEFRN